MATTPQIELAALRRMAEVSARINAGHDLAATLQAVTDGVVEALGFGVAALNFRQVDGSFLVVAIAGSDDARDMLDGTVMPASAMEELLTVAEEWGDLRYVGHATPLLGDTAVWRPDVPVRDAPDAWHPDDSLFAPLYSVDRVLLGVLSVDLPPGGVHPDRGLRSLLELFAVQAGIALDNARTHELLDAERSELQHLATHDSLTGLANRRVLITELEALLAAGSAGEPRTVGWLLYCDLDGFKPINDDFGHGVGDDALREVADRLAAVVGSLGTLSRVGGDEFVVLVPGADHHALAARLAEAVAAPLTCCSARIGVSVGETPVRSDEADAERVLLLADRAMYAVKRGG